MTKFEYLCNHTGRYDFTDKKTGKRITGNAHYIIIVKDGECFPLVKKCNEDVFRKTCEFKKGQGINLFFDENQRVSDVNPI